MIAIKAEQEHYCLATDGESWTVIERRAGKYYPLVSYHLTLVRFCAKIPSDHSWNDGCVLEPLGCGGSSATGFGQVVAIRACDALDYPDVEQPA